MYGLLEGVRGGTADSRAAEALRLQREQAAMQRQLQEVQLESARMGMDRQRREQADIDAAVEAWNSDGPVPNAQVPGAPVVRMPNPTPPVGLEPPTEMPMPAGQGSPGAAPAGQVGLSKFDRAVGTAALRRGNFDAAYKLKDRAKAEGIAAGRKTEFQRLMGMSNEDLVAAFEPMNANPGFRGMLSFDPKSKQFLLVSQIPGLETQSMTKEELVNSMMGIWEAGNGDFAAGMAMMMNGAQRRRDIDNSNFARSGDLARSNADAYFKGRQLDATDAQRAEQARHNRAMEGNASARLGLERGRLESGDWKIIGTTADKKGLLYFNERTRQTEARPLPEGADADGLFRRLTGQGQAKPMTELEKAQAYKAYVEGGMSPAEARAKVEGVNIDERIAAAVQQMVAAKAAAKGGPNAATPPAAAPAAPAGSFPGLQQPGVAGLDLRRLLTQPPRDPNYDPRALVPTAPRYGQPGYMLR